MIEVLVNYLMFGLIENVVIFMWLKWIKKENNVKWIHLIPISIGSVLCWMMTIPFMKQLFGVVMFTIYLLIVSKENIFKCFKETIKPMMYLLCIETISCIFIDNVLLIDISNIKDYNKFLILIPIRVFEIFILFIYTKIKRDGNKIWGSGGTDKRLSKKKTK